MSIAEQSPTNRSVAITTEPKLPPVEYPLPDEAATAIHRAFSLWMAESLAPVAFGFIWLYVIFGFAHLFTLPSPIRWVMSITAFGTAALLWGLRALWQRNLPQGQWAHAGAAGIAGLIWLNSGLHLSLTGEILQSSNLMLLVVGIGFFFLSSRWFVGALLVIYTCWGLAIFMIAADPTVWVHFTFGLLSASVLATSAHIVRKRTLRRVTLLRLQDKERTKQLQEALTAEQAIEEALRQSEARLRSLYDEVERRAQELHVVNTQLAQAARIKDEFLASVSHELRTPLTAILGLTQSLQEDLYGPLSAVQQSVLRNIDQSGRHLLALITDILDVAKIEAGQFTFELGPAAVDAVCQASVMLLRQKVQQRQLQLSTAFDAAVKMIETDDRRLKQILVNLLDNAVKFTPEGGAIGLEVKGDAENKIVRFTVWDTGIGIAPADFPRLFKAFVQLDSRLSREYAGSGLGLVLVYHLAEMQGGSVTVESDGCSGSRFTVSLPWRVPAIGMAPASIAAETPHPPVLPVVAQEAEPPLVLIADDHPLVTTALSELCSVWGLRAVVAQSGAEALEKACSLRPALLLIDMQLPLTEGTAVLAALRSDAHLQATPIIAMSAVHWPGCETRYLTAGANAYACKPIGPKQLQELLRQWLPIVA